MSKFRFEQVFRRTTTSVLWPEEYFTSIGNTHKHDMLLAIYAKRDSLLNVNSSWISTQTDTERRLYVELSEAEYEQHNLNIDNVTGSGIVPGTGYTQEENDIIDEVFDYCKQTGIFFKTGFDEVDNLGNVFPMTLTTTDEELQKNFYDLNGM